MNGLHVQPILVIAVALQAGREALQFRTAGPALQAGREALQFRFATIARRACLALAQVQRC